MGADRKIRVEVVYGAEHQELHFPRETTVGDIEDYLRHVINIPRDSKPRVDGKKVSRKHRLRKDCTLEFIKPDGRKGGDSFRESRLLKLGATPEWIDAFCESHPHPDDWHEGEGERHLNEDAILRALFMPNDQQPTLDSECQRALDHFKKTKELKDISAAKKFSLVAAFWAETEGLKPAQVRDKFRKVVSPNYHFPKDDDKSARLRAKMAIIRGRKFIETLD